MLIIDCPHCGAREEAEFACGGEAHIARPLARNNITDAEFADYLFLRDNPKGLFLERWCHTAGCRRWFNVARDTVSHAIIEIYPMGALPKSKPAASAFKNSWRRQSPAEKAASPKTGAAKIGAAKTGAVKIGAVKTGAAKTGAAKATSSKTGAAKATSSKTGAAKATSAKAVGGKGRIR